MSRINKTEWVQVVENYLAQKNATVSLKAKLDKETSNGSVFTTLEGITFTTSRKTGVLSVKSHFDAECIVKQYTQATAKTVAESILKDWENKAEIIPLVKSTYKQFVTVCRAFKLDHTALPFTIKNGMGSTNGYFQYNSSYTAPVEIAINIELLNKVVRFNDWAFDSQEANDSDNHDKWLSKSNQAREQIRMTTIHECVHYLDYMTRGAHKYNNVQSKRKLTLKHKDTSVNRVIKDNNASKSYYADYYFTYIEIVANYISGGFDKSLLCNDLEMLQKDFKTDADLVTKSLQSTGKILARELFNLAGIKPGKLY